MAEKLNEDGFLAETDLHLFRKSLPLRVKLGEIIRILGDTKDEMCLDIGFRSGLLSYHLRQRGGAWHSMAVDEEAEQSIRAAVAENVYLVEEGQMLPFKDKIFDAVVVSNYLENARNDMAFIAECNRVLKPTGRLVLHVSRIKSGSAVNALRRVLGVSKDKLDGVRPGYTESQLFHLLKQGFDVHSVRTHSRFFLEMTNAWVSFLHRRVPAQNAQKLRRLYSVAGPLFRFADQLDMLLFLSKGFYMVAGAKRRSWRARNAPILHDGRTISEAVLSKPAV